MLRDKTLAVLGAGMMGGALARGLVHANAMPPSGIRFFDTHTAKAEALAADLGLGASAAPSPQAAVAGADLVLLAVKPPMVADVLAEIGLVLTPAHLVISIAAGIRLDKMEALLPPDIPVIRTMPNTPCLVGKGATALCRGSHATGSICGSRKACLRLSVYPSKPPNVCLMPLRDCLAQALLMSI